MRETAPGEGPAWGDLLQDGDCSVRSGPPVGERAELGLNVVGVCWYDKGFNDVISKASYSCSIGEANTLSSDKAHFQTEEEDTGVSWKIPEGRGKRVN